MKFWVQFQLCLAFTFVFSGCRTLDVNAENVYVVKEASPTCKNLGDVNIDWSWWGQSSENLNVLKNQVVEKGGNTLVLITDTVGAAYRCL